ncbi:hypothetical protein ACFL3Q_00965 [Planctomycetota bacterium]
MAFEKNGSVDISVVISKADRVYLLSPVSLDNLDTAFLAYIMTKNPADTL